MRPLAQCRVAADERTVREVLVAASVPGRRSGAIMLVDAEGRLSGIFTDSDLARLFEHRRDRDLDVPIRQVMTRDPLRVESGSPMVEAVAMMSDRKISELPVVDAEGRPVGLIDITDVVALLPKESTEEAAHGFPGDIVALARGGRTGRGTGYLARRSRNQLRSWVLGLGSSCQDLRPKT